MNRRRATTVRVRLAIARLLVSFAVLLQCLAPVLVQAMPVTQPDAQATSPQHPAHCPHHPAMAQAAAPKAAPAHGFGLCCGTHHCVCAVSVAVINDIRMLPAPGVDHPLSSEQSLATAQAFDEERLRPPDPLRNV